MSRKGGYQILDLSGVTIVSGDDTPPTGQLKAGTFVEFKLCDKPILVSGMNVDGTKYPDSYATYTNRNNANYVTIAYLFTYGYYIEITINSDDSITCVIYD